VSARRAAPVQVSCLAYPVVLEIAVALGSDLSRLEQLRASLRTRFEQSSLRDEKRFTAKFEEVLRVAWQQHLERSK